MASFESQPVKSASADNVTINIPSKSDRLSELEKVRKIVDDLYNKTRERIEREYVVVQKDYDSLDTHNKEYDTIVREINEHQTALVELTKKRIFTLAKIKAIHVKIANTEKFNTVEIESMRDNIESMHKTTQ